MLVSDDLRLLNEKGSRPTAGAIPLAIRAAGGAKAVAARFGINKVSVYEWAQNGNVPSDRATVVAEMAMSKGLYVPLEELCPSVDWEAAKTHMLGLEARERWSIDAAPTARSFLSCLPVDDIFVMRACGWAAAALGVMALAGCLP